MSQNQTEPTIYIPTAWDQFKSFVGWTALIVWLTLMTVYAVILLNSAMDGGVEKFFEDFPIKVTVETNDNEETS